MDSKTPWSFHPVLQGATIMKAKLCAGAVAGVITCSLLLGTASRPAAAASDTAFYPGSLCVPTTAVNATGKPVPQVTSQGTIFNTSTTKPLSVVCPIARTRVGRIIAPSQIVVFDGNPTAGFSNNVVCQLVSRNAQTQPEGLSGGVASGPFTSTEQEPQILNFAVPIDGTLTYSTITCSIPPVFIDANGVKHNSGINTYRVTEETTDFNADN